MVCAPSQAALSRSEKGSFQVCLRLGGAGCGSQVRPFPGISSPTGRVCREARGATFLQALDHIVTFFFV